MPMIGVIRLSTNDLTTAPKAMPMTTATASSTRLPFIRKSRNSLSTMHPQVRCPAPAVTLRVRSTHASPAVHAGARRLPVSIFEPRRQTMATIAATDYQMPIGGEWGESERRALRRHQPGDRRGRRHRRQRDRRRRAPRDRRGRGGARRRGRRWPRSSARASCAARPTSSAARGRSHRRRDDRRAGQAAGRGQGRGRLRRLASSSGSRGEAERVYGHDRCRR